MLQLSEADQVSVPSVREKGVLLLKIARPRTWMFALVSFLFAYFSGETPVVWQVVLGVAIFSLGTAATNLINAYTDMAEDQVNNPFRLTWIRRLGVRNLIYAIIAAYSLVIILAIPFGPLFTGFILLSVFDSIFYSLPPLRFKSHLATGLIAFSGAIGLPFLAGLAAVDQMNFLDPWFLLFTVFMLAYGAVKNIPDFVGDQVAGLRTTATAFGDVRIAVVMSSLLLLAPYLLLIAFIGMDVIGPHCILNLPFMAFPIYWAYKNLSTVKGETMEKLHTHGFIYAVSFLLFNLFIRYPTLASVAITVGVLATIYLVSQLQIDSRKELTFNNLNYNLDRRDDGGALRH